VVPREALMATLEKIDAQIKVFMKRANHGVESIIATVQILEKL
jgi:hypothetical protein